MNPLTNVKNIQKMNDRMLEMGVEDNQAWHKQYKDSAYVFIGGLPYDLTEGDILCVFSQYGEIVNINLVRDKKTGKTKGFCFLCYEDQRSTILAVDNLNGIKLGGRIIRVDHCANYRRPKGDEKDEHGNRKEIIEQGCAPKTPSPSPPASDEEEDILELPKKRKKEKKAKKQKKHKEEKSLKKKKITASSGEEDLGETKKKLDLFRRDSRSERAPARASETERDKRERIERDLPRDNDSRDLKTNSTRDSARDRVERDLRGHRQGNSEEYDSRSVQVRDVREREPHERDREMRHRERQIHERDRETRNRERDRETHNRERDVHERDVGSTGDREYRDNHDRRTSVDRREQKDRAYYASREHRDREVDERRKDRYDKRRDYREDEGRTHERRDRNDYGDRKERR